MTVTGMIGVVRSARSMVLTVAPDQHERRTFDMAKSTVPRSCSVPGCPNRHASKGFCSVHYFRWKNNGDPCLLKGPRRTLATPRPPIIDSGCARIPLTQGRFAVVDESDVPTVGHRAWYVHASKGMAYAVCMVEQKALMMHRLILGVTDSGPQVDHVNGNGLDNRRCNLRLCDSTGLNQANARLRRDSTSGFKGVSWYPRSQRWSAHIARSHIGYFATPEEAARAYDKAAIARWGEFARTNAMLGLLPFDGDDA